MNDLTFSQAATLLNSIVHQATGAATITPTNTSEFVSVAQTALKVGYDPILNAINQVMSKSIFSIRPYSRKFKGLEKTASEWGAITRKLKIADRDIVDDQRYKWPVAYDTSKSPASGDGESVDMYKIRKPDILQTNFYGQVVYSDWFTLFKDQLDCAFKSPDEFSRFVTMVTQNASDKLEQYREDSARAVLANFIGGILDAAQADRVVHLVTEYNALTGLSLTAQTVYQPDNYRPFMQWVYSRIDQIINLMTERSIMFQTIVNNKRYNQHTPKNNQRVFLYAPAQSNAAAMALSNTFSPEFIKRGSGEIVNFWQSIDTPDSISVTPGYIGTDGAAKTGSAVEQAGIFGVIADEEAMGYALTQQWSSVTPLNSAGGYTNYWLHETLKCFNDHTEKGVVLLLD